MKTLSYIPANIIYYEDLYFYTFKQGEKIDSGIPIEQPYRLHDII